MDLKPVKVPRELVEVPAVVLEVEELCNGFVQTYLRFYR
jgi:hypothetical protein